MAREGRDKRVDRALFANAVLIAIVGLGAPLAHGAEIIPTWQLLFVACLVLLLGLAWAGGAIARSQHVSVRAVLARGVPKRAHFRRPWMWAAEGVLVAGC